MKGWIQRSRYKRELARRGEAASRIQAGVSTVVSILRDTIVVLMVKQVYIE